ncbi:MAG: peptidyl-prolyl cis-trans isomerase [Holosporaceae bacterium]|jgi:peptidyl-prolyl cis-trans isomerase C|nr:peptidyl-prolyl cis-trans isomerase [Holosporaceae bacterium]
MKARVMCASTLLAAAFFDANGGALKKPFSKGEQSEKINIEEQKAHSEDAADATDGGSVEAQETELATAVPEQPAVESPAATSAKATAVPEQPAAESPAATSAKKKEIVGDPIVLRINGRKEFRRSQILEAMKMIPPHMLQGLTSEKIFEILVEQKLHTYLLTEQAKKAGIDRRKEFCDSVEQFKEDQLGRMLLMIELSPKIENESALKARYTKYLVEFKKCNEFKVFHIMVNTETEAKDVLAALNKGEDFSKVAKVKSIAPSKDKGGEEGYIPIDRLPPQIKDKIVCLKAGEYSKEFVKIDDGYHIFKVADIRETTPQKYDDAMPMLKQVIMHEEATKLLDRLKKGAKIERYNEDGTVAPVPTIAP